MIPKIIHYVWLGGNEKSPLIKKCIASWKKYAPDYKIIEWNEDTFDVNSHPFVKASIKEKYWAYASDYIRLHAIKKMGGVYLDTDCELKQNIDRFLDDRAFVGFESWEHPFSAAFGAEKNHPWISRLLKDYEDIKFRDENGRMISLTNTTLASNIMKEEYGVKCNGKQQTLKDGLVIYPAEYLTLDTNTFNNYITHHFNASWTDDNSGKYKKIIHIKNRYKFIWMMTLKPLLTIKRRILGQDKK